MLSNAYNQTETDPRMRVDAHVKTNSIHLIFVGVSETAKR